MRVLSGTTGEITAEKRQLARSGELKKEGMKDKRNNKSKQEMRRNELLHNQKPEEPSIISRKKSRPIRWNNDA